MHTDGSENAQESSGTSSQIAANAVRSSGRYSEWWAVLIIVGIVALIRIPLRFDWFGEQDQARFLVDSILYHYEGVEIARNYFIQTSPLCIAIFSWMAGVFGNDALLPISNHLGVLAGILTTLAVYVLARTFAVGRLWAGSIAIGSGLIPGVFMTSLYGYPSIYALPFAIAAAAAVSHGVTRDRRADRLLWFGIGCVAYTLLVLIKIDFALLGMMLFGVVLAQRRVTIGNVLLLLAIAAIAALVALICIRSMLPDFGAVTRFASGWDNLHSPYRKEVTDYSTVWLTAGIGTLVLFAGCIVASFVRLGLRSTIILIAAWIISIGPITSFWASIPPASTRHIVPGALFTVFTLGLIAAKLFPRRRAVALLFPLLLVASNWPWAEPGYDLNYHLSGNLYKSYSVNRRVFATCHRLVDRVVSKNTMAVIAFYDPKLEYVPGTISLTPLVRYELTKHAIDAWNKGRTNYDLVAILPEKQRRLFFACTKRDIRQVAFRYRPKDVVVFSSTITEFPPLSRRGITLTTFDFQAEYEKKDH
jgi:hypothetical protein